MDDELKRCPFTCSYNGVTNCEGCELGESCACLDACEGCNDEGCNLWKAFLSSEFKRRLNDAGLDA